ncbi:MAG: hypothetical protein IPI41_00295 [Flavobacteriales bacterium]|nr:hypothetical protein [Flavobacteriales bacterium]
MLEHKTSPTSIPRPLQRMKETLSKRQSLINEINFTYRRLLRMLPAITKRVHDGPVERTFAEQDEMDGRLIRDRLGRVATEHGLTPEACTCEEAEAMVESVRYADRAARTPAERSVTVLAALTSVRAFLIRLWDKLIGALSPSDQGDLRTEAKALQEREAELHRELITLAQRPGATADRS